MQKISLMIALFGVLLFGCISNWQTVTEPIPEYQGYSGERGIPAAIESFSMSENYNYYGDDYDAKFVIVDGTGERISPSGRATLKIVDDYGNIVYETTFTVRSGSYKNEVSAFSGKNRGKYYKFSLSSEDFGEYEAYDGTAKLVFVTDDGKTLRKEALVSLPYSYDYDDYYGDYDYEITTTERNLSNSKTLETNPEIEILMNKSTFESEDYYGEEYNDYTVYFNIRNNGDDTVLLYIKDASLEADGFEYSYSDADWALYSEVVLQAGETIPTYIAFSDVPEDAVSIVLNLEFGPYSEGGYYGATYRSDITGDFSIEVS